MRRFWVLAVVPFVGCAQLLSYDDYRERAGAPVDGGVAADTLVDDTAVEDTGPPPARVPARPGGAAVASGKGKTLWLAARTYSYGASTPDGVTSSTAWTFYGYDLDEVCTSERDSIENRGTCRRPPGAKQDSLIDGQRCRDNNFGRAVGAVIGILPDAEKSLNDLVRSGSTTWILRIDDLDPDADDAFAPGALYRSSDDRTSATPPSWDGNDDRGVQSDSIVDGDVTKAVLTFPRGYVSSGVWVSGDPAPMKIIAPISSVGFFPVNLASAQITVELDAGRTTGAHALLVGALPAAEIKPAVDQITDFLRVCPGTPLYESTLTTFLQLPDLSVGAPKLQDLERTCDGVSAAVAFEVSPIKPVTRVVAPIPPRKPRCTDAG
ncbi:MAG: hypothetical protein HYV09_28295 [Deltaproteobacteria bacterium]|nr:hypothetical protein [Deltaproteobacteria bacterium]